MVQSIAAASRLPRREFLKRLAGGAPLFASLPAWGLRCARDRSPFQLQRVSENLLVIRGTVNTGLLTREGAVLAIGGDPRPEPPSAERVLLTHHRRDAVWAGVILAQLGAAVTIPEAERRRFADTAAFWDFFSLNRWHDYVQPCTRVSVEPWPIADTVRDGSVVLWRGLEIGVLATPGYTAGAVSYLLDLEGKRIGFTGDLIYGDGQVFDLYSLQDAIPEARVLGYHGFMARASQMVDSLRELAAQEPDLLVPSRGPIIERPQEAINTLTARLQAVYRNYLSTSSLRWFVSDRMPLLAGRVLDDDAEIDYVATAETRDEHPTWLRAIQNSRLLVSESGAAFLIDCGGAFDELAQLLRSGSITAIEGIYVTHYHDDHVHNVQAASEAFACPVYACAELRDILMNPRAYRMPAQTSNAIGNVVALENGGTFEWREFRLQSFFFPGQTLYHGSLRVEGPGERLHFIGDSLSPAGFDDYCPQNRQFVRAGAGFLRCLDLLEADPETFLVGQHIRPLFRFSREQLAGLRHAYLYRLELLRAVLPWDDVNFGLDEGWARCYPYEVHVQPGEPVEIAVRILNHSDRTRIYHIRPHPPRGWQTLDYERSKPVGPEQEADLAIRLAPAAEQSSPVSVLTVDVGSEGFDCARWAEALILVEQA
jgi:glyoxylase-like metal-dependent hydrolase (beta-lactamase superfamily II)